MLDPVRARRYLKDFDLRTLFIEELGWDRHRQELSVPVDGEEHRLHAVAHKCGLVAFLCAPTGAGAIPPYATRRRIETQVAQAVNQHLIVYTDADHQQQVWQWVKREAGRPTAAREQTFHRDQSGERLIQRLQAVAFSLDEEERLTIVDVAGRVKAGFDVERITKRFYERFKAEHGGFLKFLRGIPDESAQRWYASVMINRLMFIYFIQKKGFLDGDLNYLRTRLAASAAAPGQYYTGFLRPLFFEGFARRAQDRSPDVNRLLGQVPYLNGGLFQEHPVERVYGAAIQIDDAAFERLFEFFDAYNWHLDERPLRADNEINPDVLGYIFEKYINQKQMGAYYTKEDITGYISQVIVAFLLDEVRRRRPTAFEGAASVWQVLRDDPDRYIYPAMRHGAALPLPPEIAAGLTDVAQRTDWNRPAPAEYALPTEIWREVVARRQRCEEVCTKLAAGEVRQVNDLITHNLDLRQFAQDVIAGIEDVDVLRAFWHALEAVTVLDPTVGSGAFLFAALNVLEPLYEGCLERMQAFLDDLDRSTESHRPEKLSDFRKVLARVAQHPNRRYFILKSIVVNNLYGVDLMEEAVEICKLRLFLKLVAQVERVDDVEPLPDIDFNVRAGNTLVGYATRAEVERALTSTATGQGKLMFAEESDAVRRFEEAATDVERLFTLFRQQQTELGGQVTPEDKAELRRRLDALDDELNRALAREYGVEPKWTERYQTWLKSHRPFHWFVEFYGIMRRGGFDVVIGNPPYVEYRVVKEAYKLPPLQYRSESAGNLYAYCMERAGRLLSNTGWFGMIVPAGVLGLDDALPLRRYLLERYSVCFCSTYAIRPSKLFDGVDQRLCIYLASALAPKREVWTTRYHHWNSEERPSLFALLKYSPSSGQYRLRRIPQVGTQEARQVLDKIETQSNRCVTSYYAGAQGGFLSHYHRSPRYWIRAMDFEPYFKSPTRTRSVHHFRDLHFRNADEGKFISALLNSSLFFFWFVSIGNGRNLTGTDVESFPIGSLTHDILAPMSSLFDRLMRDYVANSVVRIRQDCEYQEFQPSLSKPIIDDIDRVLARHYGFTAEELDFIINYDIKYRMGKDEGEVADEDR